MKISLIIPAYNEEKYIGRCLESVQKYATGLYEIIVINNASTDNTSAIAQSFPGVRVIFEDKKGLTKARQRGFLEAKGDVLAYIDADTYIASSWFDIMQKEFTNHLNTASLSGPYIYYDIPRYQQYMVSLYWNVLGRIAYWITRQMVVGGNFAIRRDVLVKMSGFDTSIEFYGEDTNIARRARLFGKVCFNFKFVINTSGRRLLGQGLLKTALIYVSNFLSETIIHRPVTSKYRDIR
jgi:glycosyltransferase involved in cell wall biosynthesis